jgi:hypothetical protein
MRLFLSHGPEQDAECDFELVLRHVIDQKDYPTIRFLQLIWAQGPPAFNYEYDSISFIPEH